MIYKLRGIVERVSEGTVVLSVGPVWCELSVPGTSSFSKGSESELFVCAVWNQEQGPSFFGFGSELDRALFLLVTGCQGFGPRIALSVISQMGAALFVSSVSDGDSGALSKIHGIGPRKAEQMIFQLQRKVVALARQLGTDGAPLVADIGQLQTLTETLESLGYSRPEVSSAIAQVRASSADGAQEPFDKLLRRALSILARPA